MKHLLFTTALLSIASAAALAQPAEPGVAPGRYVGPAAPGASIAGARVSTVKELLDAGKDKQYVTLKGRIVSQERNKHYTFADATGRISVEISSHVFPAGQTISDTTTVEITGKFEREYVGSSELEVKQIKVILSGRP